MDRYYIEVGGYVYVTQRTTLEQSPLLARFIQTHDDPDNMIFIDRDAQAFYHVLNYMRTGSVFVGSDDRSYVEHLIAEANYYQLHSMVEQLNLQINGGKMNIKRV